nr:MAG TPA: hypothetical protein [Caudoviricetes sp.]
MYYSIIRKVSCWNLSAIDTSEKRRKYLRHRYWFAWQRKQ